MYVVVEWLYYSKRIIIDKRAELSDFFRSFSSIKCVFCFTSNEIFHFSSEKRVHPKRVVDFHRERDTFRNKIMEIVEDFEEKSYNNNCEPWKSSRMLRVKPSFIIFLSFFIIFLHFFSFFHF